MTKCLRCKETKEDICFSKNSSRKNGLLIYCKECCKKRPKSRPKVSLVGQRFGKLLVLSQNDHPTKLDRLYVCICDCGIKKEIRGWDLRKAKSCGCLHRERVRNLNRLPEGEAALNGLINRYRIRANKAGLDFLIEKELFRKIIQEPCHYCSDLPKNHKYVTTNGILTYNGLDRIDSSVGYVVTNIVTCCAECNWMKGAMSTEEFFDRIIVIAKKFKLLEIVKNPT
jgi:predicted outer membrane repeat protein